jgi:NAD(P)-dependent dehydrogenase (short-subunit alcohol dehydrogenase family)
MLFKHDHKSTSKKPVAKALVTGADSHGIGREIALCLAAKGADIAIHWYRDENLAHDLAAQIRAMGRKTCLLYADMGNPGQARQTVLQASEQLGGLSVIVCNAAKIQRKSFLDISDEDWQSLHSVNLHGYFACAQEAAKLMIDQGPGGRIVMISSVNQAHANLDIAHYVASKGGVMMLARAMALELAPHAITVNLVAPGTIETDINRDRLADADFRKQKTAPIPLKRAGEPKDIADAVAYLASEEASYVTGSTIVVDGGLTI